MPSNKVTKINQVKKRHRSHRHRKVYATSVVHINQSELESKSFEIPKISKHDYDNNGEMSERNSYLLNETKSTSLIPSHLAKQDSTESSEIPRTSAKSVDKNASEIQEDFRHSPSAASIQKIDNSHWKSLTSRSDINKKDSYDKRQRSKHNTTSKRPKDLVENKRKALSDVLDKKKESHTSRRLKRICGKYSSSCCLASVLGSILLVMGLAALIASLVLLSKNTATSTSIAAPTGTSSTISTLTSTTSSTVTTTTTTTTTSTTTFTTSTSVTSTSSTSSSSTTSTTSTATSTTSISVTSTSSTSTSSTASTTSTQTTSISTTVTTTSIVITSTTTQAPPCPPTSVGSSSTLWTTNSPTTSVYACQAYSWTASTTGSVSLKFQLQHSPGRWYLDDVSVFHGGTQLLSNGGFEGGVLSPWIRTAPNGNSCGGQQGAVTNSGGSAKTGSYYLWDGQINCYDQVEQSLNVVAGETYVISFWLRSTTTSGSPIYAKVLIS